MDPVFRMLKNTELIQFIIRYPKNRRAWEEFYCRFDYTIRGMLWRMSNHSKEIFGLKAYLPIDDLVQDVYVKLIQNDMKALRDFEGENDASIFAYLNVIAHNVVNNHIDALKTRKRQATTVPLQGDNSEQQCTDSTPLIERLKSFLFDTELIINYTFLKEEIEQILRKITKNASQERDLFLFKLAVFEDLTAEEITRFFPCGLTAKRIGNIVAALKQNVRAELFKRFSLSN